GLRDVRDDRLYPRGTGCEDVRGDTGQRAEAQAQQDSGVEWNTGTLRRTGSVVPVRTTLVRMHGRTPLNCRVWNRKTPRPVGRGGSVYWSVATIRCSPESLRASSSRRSRFNVHRPSFRRWITLAPSSTPR